MIELKMTFKSVEEAAELLSRLAGEPTYVVAAEPPAAPEPAASKRGPGRPRKGAAQPETPAGPAPEPSAKPGPTVNEEPAPEPEPATEEQPAEEQPAEEPAAQPEVKAMSEEEAEAYLRDKVRPALSAVMAKHGQDAARAFLESFGVPRISTLPVERYVEFVEKCEAKAAEPKAA